MNCFEAKQEFRAFWRKELEPNRRAELNAHLEECPGCDLAFRTFALSAPLLHSEREPAANPDPMRATARAAARPSRYAAGYGARTPRRAWASVGAAAAMLMVGIFAAYFSVNAPVQSVSDAITQPSPFVEVFGGDVTETGGDLAG